MQNRVDSSSGWNTFLADEDWTECSASLFAPASGLLELLATGLERQEVQFRVDDALSRAYTLPPRRNAYSSRPVLQGHHRVAVRWRGPRSPSKIEARFLYLSRTLRELERDAPDVAAVMKKNRPADFEPCDVIILSQPRAPPARSTESSRLIARLSPQDTQTRPSSSRTSSSTIEARTRQKSPTTPGIRHPARIALSRTSARVSERRTMAARESATNGDVAITDSPWQSGRGRLWSPVSVQLCWQQSLARGHLGAHERGVPT